MEVNITSENFEREVLRNTGVVIMDFYASWCMPCKMLAPLLDKIVSENEGVKLAKVDVDENEELCREYRIMAVPTLKIFRDGKEIGTLNGVVSESRILELIK